MYGPLAMYTPSHGFCVTGQQHARRTVGEGTPILEIIDSCRKSEVGASQITKQAEMLRSRRPKGGGVLRSEARKGERAEMRAKCFRARVFRGDRMRPEDTRRGPRIASTCG